MTGFGSASAVLPHGRVVAEVRSVNARSLDVRVKLPEALGELGLWAEQLVRRRMLRGRVEASVRTEGGASVPVELDRARAESALSALRELRDAIEPGAPLPLAVVAQIPGVFVPREASVRELREAAQIALEGALDALDVERDREGLATLDDLEARMSAVSEARSRVTARSAELPGLARKRLSQRLAKAEVDLDPTRLEAEIALLADRTDVAEELARLGVHLDRMQTIVDAARERSQRANQGPARTGRELDFLLQEMFREVGTLGAKAQDHAVSRDVVAMKVELERMREQVQNVE
jgi:uncharacterized protein (TIGR00255 family)